MPKKLRVPALYLAIFALAGCQSAEQHARDVEAANAEANRLTVGTVQREVRVGMSGAEVLTVLGAPNIVTTDDQRREVWTYDKISTQKAYSTSTGGVNALVLVGALVGDTLAGGLGGGRYSSSTGASSTTQKTLTVIIRYDEQNMVRDFAYHSSTF